MEQPKRKHRATGKKPPGGRRPGAGKPPGAKSSLGYGETAAIRSLKLRVPEGAAPEVADLAGHALERIVHVMDERVYYKQSRSVLSAATWLRNEICGPVAQRMEHTGASGGAVIVEIQKLPMEEPDAKQEP